MAWWGERKDGVNARHKCKRILGSPYMIEPLDLGGRQADIHPRGFGESDRRGRQTGSRQTGRQVNS